MARKISNFHPEDKLSLNHAAKKLNDHFSNSANYSYGLWSSKIELNTFQSRKSWQTRWSPLFDIFKSLREAQWEPPSIIKDLEQLLAMLIVLKRILCPSILIKVKHKVIILKDVPQGSSWAWYEIITIGKKRSWCIVSFWPWFWLWLIIKWAWSCFILNKNYIIYF